MKSPQWQPLPAAGAWGSKLLGPFLLITFLMLAASLMFLEDLRTSVRQVLNGTGSLSGPRELTISGSVVPASAVMCNRMALPAEYYNVSQGPYNPAAIRHPVTGEWLLVYTYDEVPTLPRRLPASVFAPLREGSSRMLLLYLISYRLRCGSGSASTRARANISKAACARTRSWLGWATDSCRLCDRSMM